MPRRKKHECIACCVVDQGCERGADEECGYNTPERCTPCRPLPECFGCGEPVCRNCSSIRLYGGIVGNEKVKAAARKKYGKQRICNNCQEQMDDSPWRVIYRMARRADYSHAAAKSYADQYVKDMQRRPTLAERFSNAG